MIIHFFRERIKERINYSEVIDFFSDLPNCIITSDNDQVDIELSEPSFDFKYHFYITKRTRVKSMFKLSPEYVNTNILIEIPVLLSKFLVRKMLKVAYELSKRFDLYVYHEKISDITEFKMLDLLAYIDKETSDYMISNKVDTVMSPYDVLYDKETDEVGDELATESGTTAPVDKINEDKFCPRCAEIVKNK